MFLEEHWGKKFLAEAGLSVPCGQLVRTVDDAATAAREIGGPVVIKAQVQAGRRGKSGGVLFGNSPEEAARGAGALLGSAIQGLTVEQVLVEERLSIVRELYLAITHDSLRKQPVVLCSAQGGVDIEALHSRSPEQVLTHHIDIRRGLDKGTARHIADAAPLETSTRDALAAAITRLYALYRSLDAELAEINPLAVTTKGTLVALDCKLVIDDSALGRQPDLPEAAPGGTALERRARAEGLLYIELGGNIGVLANGAGLTMATLDAITHYGGRPANFMEIGGDGYRKAEPALSIVLANPRVKSLLVNLCGAFARTDVIVEGVLGAWEKLRPAVPAAFTIHGTGEARAVELIRQRLGVQPHDVMDDAVRASVCLAAEP
jgi:succinyl-CoA synthetase beta subunit